MKTRHILILGLAAAALTACTPSESTTATTGASGAEVPAPIIKGFGKIPVGRATPDGKKNTVISPFRPYNIIVVKGYKSGDIVGDPSTAKVNPTTGKLNLSTSKHFRIP